MIFDDKITYYCEVNNVVAINLNSNNDDLAMNYIDDWNNVSVSLVNCETPSLGAVITGISDGEEGRYITIYNSATDVLDTITCSHSNNDSISANRFETPTGADVVIEAGGVKKFVYINGKWRNIT